MEESEKWKLATRGGDPDEFVLVKITGTIHCAVCGNEVGGHMVMHLTEGNTDYPALFCGECLRWAADQVEGHK